jgi:hypothetical protein
VRVGSVEAWQVEEWPGTGELLGAAGTVAAFAPDREQRGWVMTVEFAAADVAIDFWPSQLESTGLVEVYAEDGQFCDRSGNPAAHVPLPPGDPRAVFGSELRVEMLVDASAESLEAVLDRATAALTGIVGHTEIERSGRRDEKYSDYWFITLDVGEPGSIRETFDAIVASANQWQLCFDGGWSAEFGWWRNSAPPREQAPVLPDVRTVHIGLTPWSDPRYRPVPSGRNDGLEDHFIFGGHLPPPAGDATDAAASE